MRIYFSGIGGVGIGPLAEIAFDAGYNVVGSDREAGLMTDQLVKRGLTVSFDQSGAFLDEQHLEQAIDWFVYTSALPDDHPELVLARQLGIHIAKRDELLAQIIVEKNFKLIAIAGTHGKTTTTGMMIWAMKQLGIQVSYSIGTTLSWGPSGVFDPTSEYFVYECDEFDRNFLRFEPWIAIITSIEHDHPDTYPTPESYFEAFRQFIEQSKQSILWRVDAEYVWSQAAAMQILEQNQVQKFNLPGAHNRRNATLVKEALEKLGFDDETAVLTAIESFTGTERRFERLADNLYSDYGHTPTEITATLQMARELADRVVLVYQPHQNIRQHEIKDQYHDAVFADADEIYWLPTYLSREDPSLEILTPETLTKHLKTDHLHIAHFDDVLWQQISRERENGALVLCMGAGAIDGWVREKLKSSH